MAVEIILGRAGTGKTEHCLQLTEQWVAEHRLGAKVFFIVPNQATFMTERQLAARNAGRSLLGVRVVSFDTLAREVAGGSVAESAMVGSRERKLLLAMAIQRCASELAYFQNAQSQPHLADTVHAALSEIEQAGRTVAEMIVKSHATSHAKLRDLARIEKEYEGLLAEGKLDSRRQLEILLQSIASSPVLEGALVVVDGYAGFSVIQRQVLTAIAKRAARTDIALLLDSAGQGNELFARTRQTMQQLMHDMAEAGVVCKPRALGLSRRFRSPALASLEAQFAGELRHGGVCGAGSISLVEASSELEEVRAAARQILQWVKAGKRLREIGVLARNLASYAPWIAPVFAEHKIAFFLDQRRPLTHHPLIRYLRTLLEIAMKGPQQHLVLDYLKCGLVPLEDHEIDRLENFALRHGISGDGWSANWEPLLPPRRDEESPRDEHDRRECIACSDYRDRGLVDARAACGLAGRGEASVREFVEAIEQWLFGGKSFVRQRLDEWVAGPVVESLEHRQCVSAVREVLQFLKELLGDQRVSFDHVAMILLGQLEGIEAKLAPPTLDQVLVGQIDRSRSPEYKCVILLGLNDGAFPAGFSEDSIFSDNERNQLHEQGIELGPDSQRKTLDEQLLVYVALTRASEELVLMRSVADEDGRERQPSGVLPRILSQFPDLKPKSVPEGNISEAATPAQLAVLLASRLRQPGPAIEAKRAWAWTQSSGAPEDIRAAARRAGLGLKYRNEPAITPALAAELLGSSLTCSVTRLEHFSECRFKHFVNDALGLRPRDIAEISNLDLGNAFHDVLDSLGAHIVKQKLKWSREELKGALDEMVERAAQTLGREVLISSARNGYLKSAIRRMLDLVVADQEKLQVIGTYRIQRTEAVFGIPGEGALRPLVLKTPKGRTVNLRGRIDRIDASGESYIVFDYKTSCGKRLALNDADCGLSLQLLTYILALRDNGMKADGGLYVGLMRKLESPKKPLDSINSDRLKDRPRGLFSASAMGQLRRAKTDELTYFDNDSVEDDEFEGILERTRQVLGIIADEIFDGSINIDPYMRGTRSACAYCDHRPVCRMDTTSNRYRTPQPLIAPAEPVAEEGDQE